MIEILIHHPVACLITLVSFVALTFAADRLGLIAWVAWLDRHQKGRREKDRRQAKRHGEATKEYWRMHQ
jgi:hypothetical protein